MIFSEPNASDQAGKHLQVEAELEALLKLTQINEANWKGSLDGTAQVRRCLTSHQCHCRHPLHNSMTKNSMRKLNQTYLDARNVEFLSQLLKRPSS